VQVAPMGVVRVSDNHLGFTGQHHKTIIKVCECRHTTHTQLQIASDDISTLLGWVDGKRRLLGS